MKKKKLFIICIILIVLVLILPIVIKRDGGYEYKSLVYSIQKIHQINLDSETGYDDGIIIKIFDNQIYNSKSSNVIVNAGDIKYKKTLGDLLIEMNIPKTWHYKEIEKNENNDYVIEFYKNNSNELVTMYYYNDLFSTCGTGRKERYLELNNGKIVIVGYYYGEETWSDISFYKMEIENLAFINDGIKGDDAKEFLNIIKTIDISKLDNGDKEKPTEAVIELKEEYRFQSMLDANGNTISFNDEPIVYDTYIKDGKLYAKNMNNGYEKIIFDKEPVKNIAVRPICCAANGFLLILTKNGNVYMSKEDCNYFFTFNMHFEKLPVSDIVSFKLIPSSDIDFVKELYGVDSSNKKYLLHQVN